MQMRSAAMDMTTSSASTVPLRGGVRRTIARVVWAVCVVAALGLFVVAIPAVYQEHRTPAEEIITGLDRLGLSPDVYAIYRAAFLVLFGGGCFVIAAIIVWRKPNDGMALF